MSTSRLQELRSALQSKLADNDTIAEAFKIEDGENGAKGVVVTSEQRDAFQKNLADATEIRQLIAMEEQQSEHKDYISGSDEKKSLAVAAEAAAKMGNDPAVTPRNVQTIGAAFIESDQFKDLKRSGGYTMAAPWEVKGDMQSGVVGYDESKDVYTTLPTGMTAPLGFGRTQRDPVVPMGQRTSRVRDLFPVVQTDANLIDYIRVAGYTNNASPVAERISGPAFGTKPQSSLTFEFHQAPVRTIAHWEAAHRNVLDDEPQLRALIDNELLYGLRLKEDQQILSGAGTSEDLLGILNTTGVQTQALSGQAADTVRKGATKVMLAYFEPTGVVLHPNDWEGIELLKDNESRYLITVQVAVGATMRLWNLPVVDTPAITEGTGLVGAFGLGAQLYDRQSGNIRISESHDDWFVRNAVAVLAEERIALAVKRPESFCKLTGI